MSISEHLTLFWVQMLLRSCSLFKKGRDYGAPSLLSTSFNQPHKPNRFERLIRVTGPSVHVAAPSPQNRPALTQSPTSLLPSQLQKA